MRLQIHSDLRLFCISNENRCVWGGVGVSVTYSDKSEEQKREQLDGLSPLANTVSQGSSIQTVHTFLSQLYCSINTVGWTVHRVRRLVTDTETTQKRQSQWRDKTQFHDRLQQVPRLKTTKIQWNADVGLGGLATGYSRDWHSEGEVNVLRLVSLFVTLVVRFPISDLCHRPGVKPSCCMKPDWLSVHPQRKFQRFSCPVRCFSCPIRRFSCPVRCFSCPVRRFSCPVRRFSCPVRRFSCPVRRSNSAIQRSSSAFQRSCSVIVLKSSVTRCWPSSLSSNHECLLRSNESHWNQVFCCYGLIRRPNISGSHR